MISIQRTREIFILALPIIGGMVSQNILNLVDAAMVGTLGPVALAAVGICSFLNFLAASIFIGMSVGVQSLVGRRIGEGRVAIAAGPLNGGLLLNLCLALPLSVVLVYLSPHILFMMLDDEALIAASEPYLQARFAGMTAMGINFCFRGFFSAVKRTSIYLKTIISVHIINVVLSYVFIFGMGPIPAMGVFGAGLGTTIALIIGSLIYLAFALKHGKQYGFGLHLPRLDVLRQLINISLPASVQQMFFAAGFTVFFWIASLVGTEELAVTNVLINIMMVSVLPSIGFGLAANTLVAQSMGAKAMDDAYIWGWDVGKVAALFSFGLGLLMLVFAEYVVSVFLHEAHLIEQAAFILRFIGLTIFIDALGLVVMNALQGAGATKMAMKVSTSMQWLLCLPLAYVLGPVMGYGLIAVWVVQIGYRSAQALVFVWLWKGKQWQQIEV